MSHHTLEDLQLAAGEVVRYRPVGGGRWREARAHGRGADGSVTVVDANGAVRSLRPEAVEVRATGRRARGRRGASGWEPLLERAARPAQLHLFG
jgi:hypothetical protein